MHLSKHQLLLIFTPILISFIFYFIANMIVENINYFHPHYKEVKTTSLNTKTQIYLNLDTKKALFFTMKKNIKTRQTAASWISNTILYKKDQVKTSIQKDITRAIAYKTNTFSTWRVEAIFPKQNIAIINGKILKLGAYINNAKIIKIKNDSILLKNKKGLKWVYIFK